MEDQNTAASVMEAAVLLCLVDAVMLERIQYGGFFVVGANADFPFRLCYLVCAFVELDTQLVPHLGNVEGVNIEAILFFDIGLDDGIGGNRACIFAEVFHIHNKLDILTSFFQP